MSEPSVTQQIATALSTVYAELAKFNARNGGGLVEDLHTNEHEIVGPEPNDDDYAEPMRFRAHGVMELIGPEIRTAHLVTPQVVFNALPAQLNSEHDGMHFSFDGVETVALSLDSSSIPTPSEDTGARWVCMVHNESTTEAVAVAITATNSIPINGSVAEVRIEPLTSRMISRSSVGFQVQ